MHVISAMTGREAVLVATRDVAAFGRVVSPRGYRTRELIPVCINIKRPWDAFADGIGRDRLSRAVAAAEALQLVAGVSRPQLLQRIAPAFSRYTNEDGDFDGAYGPRVGDAMPDVVRRLSKDADTRQAVIPIWQPQDVHRQESRDYPCTLTLHFLVRDGKLRLIVTMRSNDVWLGLPYDIFMFTQLQCTVARVIGVEVGLYSHVSHSLHMYERDSARASRLQVPPPEHEVTRLDGIATVPFYATERFPAAPSAAVVWESVRQRAERIIDGAYVTPMTDTERWYVDALGRYA